MTINLTDKQFQRQLEEQHKLELRRNPPQVMTTAEVAIYLNLTIDTIYQRVQQGTIPVHQEEGGRKKVFLLEDIKLWLNTLPRLDDIEMVSDGQPKSGGRVMGKA
jgi:excisionase family DNA binding protein